MSDPDISDDQALLDARDALEDSLTDDFTPVVTQLLAWLMEEVDPDDPSLSVQAASSPGQLTLGTLFTRLRLEVLTLLGYDPAQPTPSRYRALVDEMALDLGSALIETIRTTAADQLAEALRDVAHSRLHAATRRTATRWSSELTLDRMRQRGSTSKRWIAVLDEHTRHDHREVAGTTVPIDTPFTVGNVLMQYPGDPSGPPEQTYNCRCSLGLGT